LAERELSPQVSIVLFRVFTRYIAEEATGESVVGGIGLFFYIVIGSVFVGCFVALILAVMLKYARMHSHILEAAMIFLASYSAFCPRRPGAVKRH
jgi:NhaP-type Na+/H+ or K+/H+ antiporter